MKKIVPFLLLLLLACTWGSSFILMKRGMYHTNGSALFSDVQVGALRMFIASLFLLPLSIYYRKKIKSKRDVFSLAIVGTCGNFIPAFLFTYAETELSSGYAGMLNSFTPIFTLLLGGILFRQKLTINQFVGVSIAFVGMLLLMIAGNKLQQGGSWKHVTAILVATLLYGISLNTIKHRLSHLKSMEITSLAFGLLFIPGLVAILLSDVFFVIKHNPFAWDGLSYIAILSIVGTALALMVFNKIIASTSTLFASSVTYFIPIVAVILGTIDHEYINTNQLLSMLVILIGVFIANYWQVFFRKA